MIGCCNTNGVDVFILDNVAEIGNGSALGKLCFFILFIVIVDIFGSGFPTDSVTVADRFDDHIFLFDDIRNQNCASLNSVTDESDVDRLLHGSDCRFSRRFDRAFFHFFCHDAVHSCLGFHVE